MSMDIENGAFKLPISVTASGDVVKTLKTKDTYVDKDIKVTVSVADAELEKKSLAAGQNGEITATASVAASEYLTETETSYPIYAQANAHVNPVTVGVKTAGYADANDSVTVAAADAGQNTKTMYIKAGALAGSGTAAAEGNISLTALSGAPAEGSDDFYIKATADGAVSVTAAGWIDADTSVDTDGEKYYKVKSLVFHNALPTGDNAENYPDIEVAAIPSGGYLYIEEGYANAGKISLADLVPDVANIDAEAAAYILSGYTAYDKDGALITGTMQTLSNANLVVTGNDSAAATVNVITVSAGEDEDTFVVSGSKAISGAAKTTVNATGYITANTEKEIAISGTANVAATVAVVQLDGTVSNDGAVKPVISQGSSSASTTAISTTAPSDKHYVAVSTAAIAKTATVTPTVAVAGYGTADKHKATAVNVTAGAEASDTYYVGINNGAVASSGSIDGANIQPVIAFTNSATDVDLAGFLSVAPNDGSKYITISAASDVAKSTVSGSVNTTVTEGYVVSTDAPSAVSLSKEITALAAQKEQYVKVYEGDFE